ncbi:MAG TPA: hypothetical protein RMH99_25440 [Sandaracinaceae bacterium LLY-WYZ-13_1]|nr:hypothetical protein [Sandaracinaceae bacterium LLY-WYZ-13_1]
MKRAAFLALVVLAGCGESRAELGAQCELNTDCQTPYVCRLDRCRQECAATRDCPVGQLCVEGNRGLGACLLPDEVSCGVDSDCPQSLVCRRTRCTVECVEDRDCAAGARCVEEDGDAFCEDPADTRCERNSDCGADLVCGRDDRCRAECRADRDCREGARCRDGECSPIDDDADGGTPMDGGDPDAGPVPDGGPRDGATPLDDGGGADGGPVDGGAGVPCAAPSDCVAPDVALVDCVDGRCVVTRCPPDLGDCDGDFTNGCETPTDADAANCGGCGISCGLMGTCSESYCDTVADIGVAARHFCVLRSSGTLLCMGANDQGQLGRGTTSASEPAFDAVSGFLVSPELLFVGPDVTCGYGTNLYCFGDNDFAQLGTSGGDRSSPTYSSGAAGAGQVHAFPAALGGDVARGVDGRPTGPATDGFACGMPGPGETVRCWGSSTIQYTGVAAGPGASFPVNFGMGGGLGATWVAAGASHVCAAYAGETYCFGAGGPWSGQSTVGGTVSPTLIANTTGAREVAAGGTHSCARLADRTVRCWGDNTDGQVGPGVAVGSATESAVAVTGISDAIAIEASVSHTCVVNLAGEVWCWGANGQGQLGDGTTTSSATPVRAMGLDGVVQLSLAGGRSCALRFDGSVWCWGGAAEDYGVVGDATAWTAPTAHPHFPGAP